MIGRDRFKNRPPKPQQGGTPAPKPQPAGKPKQGKKPSGQPVRVEKVKCTCGHEVDFPIYEDKKDRYREERRANVTGKACGPCRKAAHEEKSKRDQEAAKIRREEKAKRKADLYRLPHGSAFITAPYDGKNLRWTVTLVVPTEEGDVKQYGPLTGGGIHTLLIKLGKMWRDEDKASRKAAKECGNEK